MTRVIPNAPAHPTMEEGAIQHAVGSERLSPIGWNCDPSGDLAVLLGAAVELAVEYDAESE